MNHPDTHDPSSQSGTRRFFDALGLAILGLLTLASCEANPAPESSPTPGPSAPAWRALGYHTGTQASLDSLTARADLISDVSCDLWAFTSSGSLDNTDLPQDVLDLASAHSMRVWACISNYAGGAFDLALGHQVLVTARTAAIKAMTDLAASANFAGINLDMENIAAADRSAYTGFVTDLATALHGAGKLLMLSVPAKESDDPSDSWSGAFDYAAIGGVADCIQLMTYDENGTWGSPGPVSGADWFGACIQYAASVISPAKLLGGLPAYGYDWDLDATASLDNSGMPEWTTFPALTAKANSTFWDAASSSPWLNYTDADGHHHSVWYENAESIKAKTVLCKQAGLGGVAVWCLGDEDASYWTAVSAGWN